MKSGVCVRMTTDGANSQKREPPKLSAMKSSRCTTESTKDFARFLLGVGHYPLAAIFEFSLKREGE
jgi:hypothetical protein